MAAFGATMQACFGPRFALGIGRGDAGFLKTEGLGAATFDGLCEYVEHLRALWRGEAVDGLRLGDTYEGPAPEVWYGTFGLPKAAAAVARAFDGVLLPPVYTPDATRGAVERIHDACRRAGRDPASVRICQCVITAPDLSDEESRALAHARAVTYLQAPGYAESLVRANGWDLGPVEALRRHRQIAASGEMADTAFHRVELMEPARLVPEEWIQESCALGSVDECVAQLERFRAAGADEISTYGSTPGQNAGLIAAWREREWSSRQQPSSMPLTT
jgi:probable F420-dependent oxidoreductase